MYARWVVGLFFTSSLLHAQVVSFKEKENRVDFIEKLGAVASSVSIAGYQRELEYERKGLSLQERSKREAALLAGKIRTQVIRAYEAALDESEDPEVAESSILAAINKDLELADESLKEELLSVALKALESAKRGYSSGRVSLVGLENKLREDVALRAAYLNKNTSHALAPITKPGLKSEIDSSHFEPSNFGGTSKMGRLSYSSKQDLMKNLTSDEESVRWVSTSNIAHKSETMLETVSEVTVQVKLDFMGVEIEAGPRVRFRRQYKTLASMFAEGLNPLILEDGSFDFHKRDSAGKVILENGKPKRRFASFFCETTLQFESEYSGIGGFKVYGVGGEYMVTKNYADIVNLTSRRVTIPDYVENKTVTIKYLAELCSKDFLKARINDKLTVEESMNTTMKNMLKGLKFAHPKTSCALDQHCNDWYANEVPAFMKLKIHKTVPRCVEESREFYRSCELRATEGQYCPIFDKNGKRLSDLGSLEHPCDKGLTCVQVEAGGWLQNWEIYKAPVGRCLKTK